MFSYWVNKFRNALRGVRFAIVRDNSFRVHCTAAMIVVACGIFFQVTLIEWFLLVGCIFGVLTAELINSAMESMARAVTNKHDPWVGAALDMASAAVFAAATGAVIIGAIIFGGHLWRWIGDG